MLPKRPAESEGKEFVRNYFPWAAEFWDLIQYNRDLPSHWGHGLQDIRDDM